MPTEVHDTHQDWTEDERIDMMATAFLSYAEGKILKTRVGTSKPLILYASLPLIY